MSQTTSTEKTQNMPKRALGNLMDAATNAFLRNLSAASIMPSDTSRCATPRMAGSTPEEAVACPVLAVELGTIRQRRRSDDDDRLSVVASLLAGPTKLVSPAGMRFSAAVGRTRTGTRRGETEEEGEQQQERGVSSLHRRYRGGSVQERAADVVRGREESGSWRQPKLVIPIMAVAAMEFVG